MATDISKIDMKQSLADLTLSLRSLAQKISPHLGFIYLTFILIGITSVVYIVSQTMQSTDVGQGAITSQKENEFVIPFDRTTISKLQTLSNENSSPSVSLPSGRINPFSESVY